MAGEFFEVTGEPSELDKIYEGIEWHSGRLTSDSSYSLDLWLDMKEQWFKRHDEKVLRDKVKVTPPSDDVREVCSICGVPVYRGSSVMHASGGGPNGWPWEGPWGEHVVQPVEVRPYQTIADSKSRDEIAKCIIERVEEIGSKGVAGEYVRQVPKGYNYSTHWPIMVAIEMLTGAPALNGATNEPAPETRVANAGEFAAIWNTRTPEEREHIVEVINARADQAVLCIIADHEGAISAIPELVELQLLKKRVKQYADARHSHARTKNNTVSSWRVWSDLYQMLGLSTKEESQ